jgi:CheY-like chemotaxis protein/HPt (histidine-containing phosphotransfer) domain-containing protein
MDDNAAVRHMLIRHLAAWGGTADEADGAVQALSMMESRNQARSPYHLVLADATHPESPSDGLHLLRGMRQRPPLQKTPVIMLTSLGQRGQTEFLRQQGAASCLTKPIRLEQLRSSLQVTLSQYLISSSAMQDTNAMPSAAQTPPLPAFSPDTQLAYRILVAEDNPINQRVAVGMLEKLGCRVDVATNGREALEACTRVKYDLVFMDCQMPEMDGFAATREIRMREASTQQTDGSAHGLRPRLPIIAITANAMQGDRERCLAAGMDDYLSKPIFPEILQRMLEQWLSKPYQHSGPLSNSVGEQPVSHYSAEPSSASHASPTVPSEEQVAVFDRNGALARVEGDQMLLGELAVIFLRHAAHMVTAIHEAVGRRDFVALEEAAHSLKGASANLCASRVAEAARQLEYIGRQGGSDKLDSALQALQRDLSDLMKALTQYGKEARPCVS